MESPLLPDAMSNGQSWPRISIVTPSYNQGRFIETTIRSVLLQGYPDFEYLIIDGGSDDQTVEIIRKYEQWLTYWISEPDEGQTHAINKGLAKTTGGVVAYLNSDDRYEPGALAVAAATLGADANAKWMCGACASVDEWDQALGVFSPRVPVHPRQWLDRSSGDGYSFPQQGVFLRKEVIDELGHFREDLEYCFDHEYWVRVLFAGYRPLLTDKMVAAFRIHRTTKTQRASNEFGFLREDLAIARFYAPRLSTTERRGLRRREQRAHCTMTVSKCWAIAHRDGRWVAMRALWSEIVRAPYLLGCRAVWGALRRWCGAGVSA